MTIQTLASPRLLAVSLILRFIERFPQDVLHGVCQTSCPPISCGVSDFGGAVVAFRVQPDGSGGLPVAGFARPAFRLLCAGICIEQGSVCEGIVVKPCVAHAGRYEADGAVKVLAVIPAGEGFHPCLCLGFCREALGWPVRAILAGAEQRLGEGPRQRARTDGARCLDRC